MNPWKRAAICSKDKGRLREEWQPKDRYCNFDQLPEALVMEILSRLSVKALFICRCVCKDWFFTISDPQFTHLHRSRLPVGILIKTIPFGPPRITKHDLTYVDESLDSNLRVEKICFTKSIPISQFNLINSCNGLICLSGATIYDPFYVCNPILGEFITIPPARNGRRWGSFAGLGFSTATNEYKVLLTNFSDNFAAAEAEIYTIGTGGGGVWRSIGNAPMDFPELPFNSYLCGALHWYSYCGNVSHLINTFCFETEQFRQLPSPSYFGHRKQKNSESFKVGVLGGCLVLSVFVDECGKIDMWVMKNYGVQESWTKTLVIETLFPVECPCSSYEPIMLLSTGEILMVYKNWDLVCYNEKTKSFRETRIAVYQSWFDAVAYHPSLVSLGNVSRGEEVKRVKGRYKSRKLFAAGSSGCASSEMPTCKSKKS